MTIDQAVAILEAEGVLQDVGCNGPDSAKGSPWYGLVKEAVDTLSANPLRCDVYDNLALVHEIKGRDG